MNVKYYEYFTHNQQLYIIVIIPNEVGNVIIAYHNGLPLHQSGIEIAANEAELAAQFFPVDVFQEAVFSVKAWIQNNR